jgi:alpha-1,6-mannosyltransferase
VGQGVSAHISIMRLGAFQSLVLGVYTLLSWGMPTSAPSGGNEPNEQMFYDRLADALVFLGPRITQFLRGNSALADAGFFTAIYATLFATAALLFILLLFALAQRRAQLTNRDARTVFRWAIALSVIAALAAPVIVQDFWASAGWGRLVAGGENPYYVHMRPETTEGLPLDYHRSLMTYGPLWALVSGAVMFAAGQSALLAGLLFKAIIAATWIASLCVVRVLLRGRTPWERCAGMAVAGWTPLTLFVILADGHNDSAPVLFILLWLLALERARPVAASLALAGSFLLKYLSAPLFLLDVMHLIWSRRAPLQRYVAPALAAGLVVTAVLAVFYRSPTFFESTLRSANWFFFTPRAAIVAAGRLLGMEPGPGSLAGMLLAAIALGVQCLFIAVGVSAVLRYMRSRTDTSFRVAIVGIITALLFGIISHSWPWYLAWALLPAALVPASRYTRWIVGVSLTAPLALLYWVMFPSLQAPGVASLWMFTGAVLWFVSTHRLFPGTPAELQPAPEPSTLSLRRRAHSATIYRKPMP